MRALPVFQGVDIGHQVTTHAERVDQLLNPSGLVDLIGVVNRDVLSPVDRHVGNTQCRKDVFIEVAATNQQLVNSGEEFSRPCPLNHAVVVSRGQGNGLPDTEVGE